MIKVFRHGEGTQTRAQWTDGKRQWTISNTGTGHFLEHHFGSVAEAKQFCETALHQDRSATFYILLNDVIEETVLDEEFHIRNAGMSRRRWSVLSLLIVTILAWLIFVTAAPFESSTVNFGLVGGSALLCLIVLWVHNWKVFESMVVMGLLLLLALLLTSAVKRKRQRVVARDHPTAVAFMPASPSLSAFTINARAW